MALRTLLLRSKVAPLQAELDQLRTAAAQFSTREAELASAIGEAQTDEERGVCEAAVTEFEGQVNANQTRAAELEAQIAELEGQIRAAEEAANAAQRGTPAGDPPAEPENVRYNRMPVNSRTAELFGATRAEREAFIQREDVRSFLDNVRSLARTRRSVTGAELGVPVVLLDVLRQNVQRYSKLLKHVRFRSVLGTARQNIAGKIPEAIWTECRAALNELEISFTQIEADAFKVGGFIAIPNSDLADDVGNLQLAATIVDALGQAIYLALDKAIVYGTGDHMPVGFVTRLAAQSQPSWWGTHQAPFTDLHSSNILQLNLGSLSGVAFFQPLMAALSVPKATYSQNGELVWIMTHKTHMDLLARALNFNAAGSLVAGMNNVMPVIGGTIVEEDRYMADYEIAGGYLDCELIVEREGSTIAQSEHAMFVEDQTVFKGTARYDGKPVFGEAFVLVNYNNTAPTTSRGFGVDYANTGLGNLIVVSVAGTNAGDTAVTVAGNTDGATLKYAFGAKVKVEAGQKISGSAWKTYTAGTDITATTGDVITVVELDDAGKAVKSGYTFVTSKA